MTIKELQEKSHKTAVEKGFWGKKKTEMLCTEPPRNKGELIALMHSELSECLEALRKEDKDNEAEELADLMIRIGDYAEAFRIDLTSAIESKMKRNKKRPYKHGKKF